MSSLYPDLDGNDAKPGTYGTTTIVEKTNYGTTTPVAQPAKTQATTSDAAVKCSKCWIALVGFLSFCMGIFFAAVALNAHFVYIASIPDFVPPVAVWSLLGFGITLSLCSILLVASACCYQKGCFFRLVLGVFASLLICMCVAELVASVVFIIFATGSTLETVPEGTFIYSELLKFRNEAVNSTYQHCCVQFPPPYANLTVDNVACQWPAESTVVVDKCGEGGYTGETGSLSIFNCVCDKALSGYGMFFGDFLAERTVWIGGVAIAFACLLLTAIVCSCILICKRHAKAAQTYTPQRNYPDV